MRSITIYPADVGGNKLIASFAFDRQLVALVKACPGAEWDHKAQVWKLPGGPETLVYLRDHKSPDVALSIDAATRERFRAQMAALQSARLVREAGDSAIDFAFRTKPYAHQRAGLDFLVRLGGGALLWEMGLGKTKTAIDYVEYLAATYSHPIRVLVIAPNTVVRNWQNEIELHAGHHDYLTLTGMPIPVRVKKLGLARYSLVNCEALSHKSFAIAAADQAWDVVIVDESTRFKTPSAERTKALHRIGAKAAHRIILTGTPITGNASDAWSQFEFVTPGVFGSYWRFRDQFLELDWFKSEKGIKEGMTQELADRIGRRSYRVLKSQVLDLPPKVYSDRVVELAGSQLAAYRQMRDQLRVEIENLPRLETANVLTMLLRLTQITAGMVGQGDAHAYTWLPDNAKVQELDHLLNEELRGEQVVIFGLYQRELQELANRFTQSAGQLLPIIYGPTPEHHRHELIEQFQAGTRRLLFAQIRTGGIGINLTAARTAIYYSRSWSNEEYLQSQDRLHRIGQTGTVSILHLVARDTVDEQIAKALAAKQSLADTLTGDGARRLIRDVLGGR